MKKQERLLNAHLKEGFNLYGDRWDTANIGWVQDDNSIASKVYGNPAVIFTSYIEKGKIFHSQENYR